MMYSNSFSGTNPCSSDLSNNEFLEHMIAHHQVAIDISYRMLKFTQDTTIMILCRNIIWSQKNQVMAMKMLWDFPYSDITGNPSQGVTNTQTYPFKYYYPEQSRVPNAQCSMMFFDPKEEHIHMMKNTKIQPMKSENIKNKYSKIWTKLLDPISSGCSTNNNRITDIEFMKHMADHHQIAIDMSKSLIKTTDNTALMDLANDILRNQQYEIWYMNNLLTGYSRYQSQHLVPIDDEKCLNCDDFGKKCRKL